MKKKNLILCQIFHHFDFSFQIVYKTKYCLDWNSGKITMVKNLTWPKKIIKIFLISLFDHTHYVWLNSYQSKKIKKVENLTRTQRIIDSFILEDFILSFLASKFFSRRFPKKAIRRQIANDKTFRSTWDLRVIFHKL